MSYINNENNIFSLLKLTSVGRQQLAKGKLTFKSWCLGDSEINYKSILTKTHCTTTSKPDFILKPKDLQPNIKTFLHDGNGDLLTPIIDENLTTVKLTINNKAQERGFFNGNMIDMSLVVEKSGISISELDGGVILDTDNLSFTDPDILGINDIIILRLTNDYIGNISGDTLDAATPILMYRILEKDENLITIDRNLPNLTGGTQTFDNMLYLYRAGTPENMYGIGTPISYRNPDTLSFSGTCDTSVTDIPVWNYNHTFTETPGGLIENRNTHSEYCPYDGFGSQRYIGTKYPYLNYNSVAYYDGEADKCDGDVSNDPIKKSVGIIHYTNNTISNFYGEGFYINDTEKLTLKIPTIMYHRNITTSGQTLGMEFISDTVEKILEDTDIKYYDLIEEPTLVFNDPKMVGKVFPQFKIITIDDEEILAAMSRKSNRNWTLPNLRAELIGDDTPTFEGILKPNQTIYITYELSNTNDDNTNIPSGIPYSMANQKYIKITNPTGLDKNIALTMEAVGELEYLQDPLGSGYDGCGFYATKYKIIYQIIDNEITRPNPHGWLSYDLTGSVITTNGYIDSKSLEEQNYQVGKIILTPLTTGIIYNISESLNLLTQPHGQNQTSTIGEETFFYGNLDTSIMADVYKTTFKFRVSASKYINTTNPTAELNANKQISEIGVYDDDGNLVLISKLSEPILLVGSNTVLFEPTIDF